MLDFGFYNMDCMDALKDYPDNYFDLAVVDPPYGSGQPITEGGQEKYYNRFGQRFDKYKSGGGNTLPKKELQKAGRNMGLCELEERGRRSMQKNYIVGHTA